MAVNFYPESSSNEPAKVLLVTIAIGEQYKTFYHKTFFQNALIYARRHAYDFAVIDEYIDKSTTDKSLLTWQKILVCSSTWEDRYDYIIFVDADVLISSNAPPIHTAMDFGDKIGIVDEFSQPSRAERIALEARYGTELTASGYYQRADIQLQTDHVLNTGVMVFQPKRHRYILEYIYTNARPLVPTHPRGFHFEQSYIGYHLQTKELYCLLDRKWNALWNLQKAYGNHSIVLEDFCRDNYFVHFAGQVDINSISALRNI